MCPHLRRVCTVLATALVGALISCTAVRKGDFTIVDLGGAVNNIGLAEPHLREEPLPPARKPRPPHISAPDSDIRIRVWKKDERYLIQLPITYLPARNPLIYNCTFPFVNDPVNIAKNKRMISINTAMSVELFGQVAADSMGWTQQSAVGGQLDFVKGAQMSEGGKSIIALASAFEKNGKLESKITLRFPVGTAVTTPRSEVQYVATEYGCINLKHLNMADRVRAMISLAHPAFRDQLTEEAKAHHLIP